MKKNLFYIFAIGALAFFACSNENREVHEAQPVVGHATFKAYIAEKELTKTTYLNEATFNWVGDEIVSMDLIKNSDNSGDRYDFYIPNLDDATAVTFASAGNLSVGQGEEYTYRLGERAYYPGQKNAAGYPVFQIGTAIKTNVSASTVTLSETFKPSVAQPLRVIPLIGNNDGSDNFAFHTATGILKVTVTGIDYRLSKVQLYSEGQQLSGTFNISSVDGVECYEMTSSSSDNTISLQYADRINETSLPFYFPVPVGTLQAGFQIRLIDILGNAIRTVKCNSDIPIERNHISEMTKSIAMPAAPSAAALAGTYYIGNSSSYQLLISDTDDASKGNIRITGYPSWSLTGSIYGYYNGDSKVSFAGNQAFNQHSNSKYYCVHGQGRDGVVRDVLFSVAISNDKYQLTPTGAFGIGEATMSDGAVTSYSTTTQVWNTCVLYQQ